MSKTTRKIENFATVLLLGVSSFALLRNCSDFETNSVPKVSLSLVEATDFHTDNNVGTVDEMADVISFPTQIDTVRAFYGDDGKARYVLGNDTVCDLPSMGVQLNDKIFIREFVSENRKLQEWLDLYNDEYRCTGRHEYQHLLNMFYGMHGYNSPEIKYAECCLDEMSASIAQYLAQLRNYSTHDKDEKYLTDRFKFMRDAVRDGRIPADRRLNAKEQEYVANCIFDEWMDVRYDIYEERTDKRVQLYLKNAAYMDIQPNWITHDMLMRKCFKIDGYNFWPYIVKREKELFDRLSKERREEYKKLQNKKMYESSNYIKIDHLKSIRANHYSNVGKYKTEVAEILKYKKTKSGDYT